MNTMNKNNNSEPVFYVNELLYEYICGLVTLACRTMFSIRFCILVFTCMFKIQIEIRVEGKKNHRNERNQILHDAVEFVLCHVDEITIKLLLEIIPINMWSFSEEHFGHKTNLSWWNQFKYHSIT